MENTSSFRDFLKGVRADFANVFDESQYDYHPFVGVLKADGSIDKPAVSLFETETTDNIEEETTSVSGFSDPRYTDMDGGHVQYEDRMPGYAKKITQKWYTKGVQVSYGVMKFRNYKKQLSEYKAMLKAGQKFKDKFAFLGVYGASANAGFGIGDGVSLASTSHPRRDGGAVQSNIVDAAYSHSSQVSALESLGAMYDNKGSMITASGEKVIVLVPHTLHAEATVINKSEKLSGSPNNDVNIFEGNVYVISTALISSKSSLEIRPGLVVSGDDAAAYVIDPGLHRARFLIGGDFRYDDTEDFDTKTFKATIDGFFGVGAEDWRGLVKIKDIA